MSNRKKKELEKIMKEEEDEIQRKMNMENIVFFKEYCGQERRKEERQIGVFGKEAYLKAKEEYHVNLFRISMLYYVIIGIMIIFLRTLSPTLFGLILLFVLFFTLYVMGTALRYYNSKVDILVHQIILRQYETKIRRNKEALAEALESSNNENE